MQYVQNIHGEYNIKSVTHMDPDQRILCHAICTGTMYEEESLHHDDYTVMAQGWFVEGYNVL